MATLTTTRTTRRGAASNFTEQVKTDGKRMTIIPEGKRSGINVRYAPREVTHTALSAEWTEVPRAGRAPLLVRSGDPQPRMSFTLFFGAPNPDVSVADRLRKLAQYARYSIRLHVNYSSWENGLWRISSLSITSTQRHPDTDEITRATADVEFVLAAEITTHIGPLTGGVAPTGGGSKDGGSKPRKHRVKEGDTLHSLAIKYYRDASKWKKIAKANKIDNPRSKRQLKVGRVLRIP